MKAATLSDIKKNLLLLDADNLVDICLRLAKYKQENKELLSYLLFEKDDESAFREEIKNQTTELFASLHDGNLYFIKKGLRKILRFIDKQIRYSTDPLTELELRVHYCKSIIDRQVPINKSAQIKNIYDRQIDKILKTLDKLPEDLRYDYARELKTIGARFE